MTLLSRPRHGISPAPGGELALIDRIRERTARLPTPPELSLGIGDDCAILRPRPGEELLVTTDFCLEGRHWSREWNSAESAGHRTLARGLSDLAAMGARPVAAFLSLALSADTARDPGWVNGFLDGLLSLAARYGVPLAGGDTSESPSPHVLADVTCLGAAPRGTALRRSGAQPGDLLYCTGTLGGSFAERTSLAASATRRARPADHPFLYPEPRLPAGEAMRERGIATACIDLSDGLSTDLGHLCDASQVGALVDLPCLPASPWLRRLPAAERLAAMLHGGEDYELLFTAATAARVPSRLGGTRITRIGAITRRPRSGPAIFSTAADGDERGRRPLPRRGWEHLR